MGGGTVVTAFIAGTAPFEKGWVIQGFYFFRNKGGGKNYKIKGALLALGKVRKLRWEAIFWNINFKFLELKVWSSSLI